MNSNDNDILYSAARLESLGLSDDDLSAAHKAYRHQEQLIVEINCRVGDCLDRLRSIRSAIDDGQCECDEDHDPRVHVRDTLDDLHAAIAARETRMEQIVGSFNADQAALHESIVEDAVADAEMDREDRCVRRMESGGYCD